MKHYSFKPPDQAARIIEEMCNKLGKEFGVTNQGTLITVRWGSPRLKYVQMSVVEVEDGSNRVECEYCGCITEYDPDGPSLCSDCRCPK